MFLPSPGSPQQDPKEPAISPTCLLRLAAVAGVRWRQWSRSPANARGSTLPVLPPEAAVAGRTSIAGEPAASRREPQARVLEQPAAPSPRRGPGSCNGHTPASPAGVLANIACRVELLVK